MFIVPAGSSSGYQIARSLRFRSGASAYLSRTPSASNRKTWTWSGWVKRDQTVSGSTGDNIFGCHAATTDAGRLQFFFGSSSGFTADAFYISGHSTNWRVTTQLFRDFAGWYHIVVAWDTTQSTAANRVKLYVNGTEVTSFATSNDPTLNADYGINQASAHYLGTGYSIAGSAISGPMDGYLSEVNFIDGQALTPSSFGQTNATTGAWNPIKYTGTYGTNGFYLPFSDNSAATSTTIGKDSSGNGNNWTPSGISITAGVTNDSLVDTPTNYGSDTGAGGEVRGNYCTLNPIDKNANLTLSEGNLTVIPASTADYWLGRATMALPTTGKWYWELTLNNTPYLYQAGIYSGNRPMSGAISATGNEYQVGFGTAYSYINFQSNNAALVSWSTNTNPTNGNVLGFAYDASNDSMWVSRNGTFYNTSGTANPATNTDPRFTSIPKGLFPGVNLPNPASGGVTMNFGQRPWANAAPSGFKALCTQNLTDPAIPLPSLYFDAVTRTGAGATQTISSLAFQPDLVWDKCRSNAVDHILIDSVRGAANVLFSDLNWAEDTTNAFAFSFLSNGFSFNSSNATAARTYVDWCWKKGATPGFDIVTYSGNGSTQSIAHSLGVVPKFIIVKSRNAAVRWTVMHGALGAAQYGYLNEIFAFDTGNANVRWGNSTVTVNPTSSVFTIGSSSDVNTSGTNNYIAYLFAEVAGFSKIGSYTGNGNADGPFIYCGFRPKWLLVRRSDSSTSWGMFDSSRPLYNPTNLVLLADNPTAELSPYPIDFTANGFKVRDTNPTWNASGGTQIFMAFAESPFKNARAR